MNIMPMFLDTVIPVGRMAVVAVFETSPPQLEAGTVLQPQGVGQAATEVLPRPTRLILDKQGLLIIAEILGDHLQTGTSVY